MESWIQICEVNTKLSVSFPKILFLWVDGTVLKTWGPSDTESARAMYNSKHGYHGYVFFVVVLPNGFISFVSLSSTGNEHDKTHYDQSDCSDLLQEAYETIPEGYTCAIGGDKAYRGIRRPMAWKNYVTKTAEKEEEKEGKEKTKKKFWWKEYTCDPGIAKFRSVVERTIGAMKNWEILSNEALLSQIDGNLLDLLILLIAALTNYKQIHNNKSW